MWNLLGRKTRLGDGTAQASAAVLAAMMLQTTTEQGVHAESLVVALGALAGRASQWAAIDGAKRKLPQYVGLQFATVTADDGSQFLFGDAVNRPLAERPDSVWENVVSALRATGSQLPDLGELFTHAAQSIGSAEFGIPRYLEGRIAAAAPREYLTLWDEYLALISPYATDPQDWPQVYGGALGEALVLMKDTGFDLTYLASIAMGSAIAMSKVIEGAAPEFV